MGVERSQALTGTRGGEAAAAGAAPRARASGICGEVMRRARGVNGRRAGAGDVEARMCASGSEALAFARERCGFN